MRLRPGELERHQRVGRRRRDDGDGRRLGLDGETDGAQDVGRDPDVAHGGGVGDGGGGVGHQGGDHVLGHRVLGAGHPDVAGERSAGLDVPRCALRVGDHGGQATRARRRLSDPCPVGRTDRCECSRSSRA